MSSRRDGSASKLPATSFMSARFQPGRLCDWIPNRPLRADRCTVSVTPPDPGANTARSARPSPSKSPPIVFVEPSGYVVVMSCGTIGLVSPNPGPAVESQRHTAALPPPTSTSAVRSALPSPVASASACGDPAGALARNWRVPGASGAETGTGERFPASSTTTTVRKFLFSPEVTGTTGTVAVPSPAAGAQVAVTGDPTTVDGGGVPGYAGSPGAVIVGMAGRVLSTTRRHQAEYPLVSMPS